MTRTLWTRMDDMMLYSKTWLLHTLGDYVLIQKEILEVP